MNIVIVGQGAMGLLWYHHLSQFNINQLRINQLGAEHNLSLLASKQMQLLNQATKVAPTENHLQQSQYHFTDIDGVSSQELVTFTQINDIQSADVIILCLKSFQIGGSLSELSINLNPNASIILAHNGMGTLDEIPKKLIEQHTIYTLLTTHGCLRTAPYKITHTGIGFSDFGLVSGKTNTAKQLAITNLLNNALPDVLFNENIIEKQWVKLAINCVINPLTALNDIENGNVNNDGFIEQIQNILTEIVQVAKAVGIELSLTELISKVQQVALATAKNSSSMRCDILANRRTEIDYINGYLHKLGLKYNIATPENTKIWQKVKAKGG